MWVMDIVGVGLLSFVSQIGKIGAQVAVGVSARHVVREPRVCVPGTR